MKNIRQSYLLTLGIIGSGRIGKGLIKLCLKKKIKPIVYVRRKSVIGQLKLFFEDAGLILPIFTDKPEELSPCDLLIEAITEDFEQKVELYKKLKPFVKKKAIISTTTSSLSINALAKASNMPERFVGLHFFHPPHYIEFVEIIPSKFLLPEFLTKTIDFIKAIGYEYVVLPDIPGFVANRILFNMLLAAVELRVENKIEETIIDRVIKESLKHPMGPFELLNFIGVDTADKILHNLFPDNKRLFFWKKYYAKHNWY